MWSTLPLFALPFISGTSFIGMHLAYINQKPWWQWEGHSWALDTAAVRFGLLSQWAAVGLVCATVPHAASYFHFLKDSPRKYLRFWYLLLKYFLPWGGRENLIFFQGWVWSWKNHSLWTGWHNLHTRRMWWTCDAHKTKFFHLGDVAAYPTYHFHLQQHQTICYLISKGPCTHLCHVWWARRLSRGGLLTYVQQKCSMSQGKEVLTAPAVHPLCILKRALWIFHPLDGINLHLSKAC